MKLMLIALVSLFIFSLCISSVKSKGPVNQPITEDIQFESALFKASEAYGRAGCGDLELAKMTARNAIRTNLPAGLIAGVVAVESRCNPLAISPTGAAGIMQVLVKSWDTNYHFQEQNIFNESTGLRVGSDILASEVKMYGTRNGLIHYNGESSAGAYADRVLQIAGK